MVKHSNISSAKSIKTDHSLTVLAIASAGGHWVQLRRLHPAFEGTRLVYVTTRESYRSEVERDGAEFRVVPDCNRWEKFKLLKSALSITKLILSEKPDVVITTGAAPGYFAIRIGKFFNKRTIWLDSIANAEELSMSGQRAGRHADYWLTQWSHLTSKHGPKCFGNVLGDLNGQKQIEGKEQSDSKKENRKQFSHTESSRKLKVFVTVGTDLPFDRLIKTLDDNAGKLEGFELFAQIGKTEYRPKNLEYSTFLEPPEFKDKFLSSDLIISHAGMGTILSSLQYQKPLIVMPRVAKLGEHRNEHQLATAKHLKALDKINVAVDESELLSHLENFEHLPAKDKIGPHASESLIEHLRSLMPRVE